MPTVRSLAQIKSNLLQPALTSHFEVEIFPPPGLTQDYFSSNSVNWTTVNQDKLNLLCSETVLPGSSIATLELNNDFHGATVRHAHRRLYDDRIDLTFYVSGDDYLPIRFFETWIKYVVGENIGETNEGNQSTTRPGSKSPYYFYRLNYPTNYVSEEGLKITKFERTGNGASYSGSKLVYEFINVFPISVSSMPVSYDSSSLLKCTVSLTYLRYVMTPVSSISPSHEDQTSLQTTTVTPDQAAAFNNAQFVSSNITAPGLEGAGGLATNVGGVPTTSANSSGNDVSYSSGAALNLF